MPEKDKRKKINKYERQSRVGTLRKLPESKPERKDIVVSHLTAALNYWQNILQKDPSNERALTRIEAITNFLKKRSEL